MHVRFGPGAAGKGPANRYLASGLPVLNATGNHNPQPRSGELHNLALIKVQLVITGDCLLIEVWDRDRGSPELKQPQQADQTGRALLIVGALCRRWGYLYPESGGKSVWGDSGPRFTTLSAAEPP